MFGDKEEFVAFKSRARLAAFFMVAVASLASTAVAAELCASADEVEAFRLRHLQSRLMVAGLSCGQKDAYNTFVTRHKPDLGRFGPRLIAYYKRSGGGDAALNRYVTELANAAASIRSDDPMAFCAHAWNMFWELEQDPTELTTLAAANPIPAILAERPKSPSVKRIPQKQTAAPLEGAAAAQ
jgi:hypothetical protein